MLTYCSILSAFDEQDATNNLCELYRDVILSVLECFVTNFQKPDFQSEIDSSVCPYYYYPTSLSGKNSVLFVLPKYEYRQNKNC